MSSVLIIDDEEKLRHLLGRLIRLEGYNTEEASCLAEAQKIIKRVSIDIVVCDVFLPDGNGVDFVFELKKQNSFLEIILLTAYGNIADGVQAMKNGAFDYITKGDDNDKLIPLLARAAEKVQLKRRINHLENRVAENCGFEYIVGESKAIQDCVKLAKKVAPTQANVLLLGETGTGKEIFAQAIHQGSPRAKKNFVAVNCSAFGKEILESEIFGHKAGAYTGALKDTKGLVEEANGGTLFLDEIGEMQLDLQSKLLRFLETSEFIKVGDSKPTKVDVRIIAATNRDLKKNIEAGTFREDLFYRLNVFSILLPALRERKEDLPLLAKAFLSQFAAKLNKKTVAMSDAFIEKLKRYPWKGNIRELRNTIERAVILAENPILDVSDLPVEFTYEISETESVFDLSAMEKKQIMKVLAYTKGNKTEAAKLLNIGLTTLYRKIEEYKISY